MKKVIYYFKCTPYLLLCNLPKQFFYRCKNENVKIKDCDLLFLFLCKKGLSDPLDQPFVDMPMQQIIFTTVKMSILCEICNLCFITAQNINCGYSLEPPHWGSSNKNPLIGIPSKLPMAILQCMYNVAFSLNIERGMVPLQKLNSCHFQ